MTVSSAPPRAGGCLCGGVRYEVRGTLRPVIMCHCTQCRRVTGHFMAATAARLADFHLTAREPLRWYQSSPQAQRGFCANCGSTLFWKDAGRDYVSITAGTLDDSSGLSVAGHIFVDDKGAYYEIDDGAPQFHDGAFRVAWP
jgi:hypothetical protein